MAKNLTLTIAKLHQEGHFLLAFHVSLQAKTGCCPDLIAQDVFSRKHHIRCRCSDTLVFGSCLSSATTCRAQEASYPVFGLELRQSCLWKMVQDRTAKAFSLMYVCQGYNKTTTSTTSGPLTSGDCKEKIYLHPCQ